MWPMIKFEEVPAQEFYHKLATLYQQGLNIHIHDGIADFWISSGDGGLVGRLTPDQTLINTAHWLFQERVDA